jgi:3-dehydroquinate synthase
MAKLEEYAQVDVELPGHRYTINICRNALNDPEFLRHVVTSKQVLIVTNQTIASFYLKSVQSAFTEQQCDVVILADGEEFKNQHSLFAIFEALIKNQHHRDTTLIALGGGVIGDITGFAASTYQRGVPYVQIPTSLLAQVDASVGGKTAINHELGKNIIGSFYQPQAVIIDLNTLSSLPEREFRSGLSEIIKYSILVGGNFFKQVHHALMSGLTADSPQLPDLIAHCCRIKASFVEHDEKENGSRALLNLGHTFAHALEAYTQYQHWLHGEAVAIGLYCASLLSEQMGWLSASTVEQVEQMLCYAGLPHKIPNTIDLGRLKSLMRLDKKIKNNCLRFVVIHALGECYLEDGITESCLHNTLIMAVEGE